MIYLIWLIPLILLIFNLGDSIADSLVVRRSGIGWYTWHIPNWIRRYSSNLLLLIIWFYVVKISLWSITFMILYIFFLWGIWKFIYLILVKRLKITIEK